MLLFHTLSQIVPPYLSRNNSNLLAYFSANPCLDLFDTPGYGFRFSATLNSSVSVTAVLVNKVLVIRN